MKVMEAGHTLGCRAPLNGEEGALLSKLWLLKAHIATGCCCQHRIVWSLGCRKTEHIENQSVDLFMLEC